eukprot:g3472.t1
MNVNVGSKQQNNTGETRKASKVVPSSATPPPLTAGKDVSAKKDDDAEKDDAAKKDGSEKKNVRAETQDDLIQDVPGTRQVIIKLVDNHGVSFKKLGHGVGIRKIKAGGVLASHPLSSKVIGLHLIAVNSTKVGHLPAAKVLEVINSAEHPVIAKFSSFQAQKVHQDAVKKVIAANRLRNVAVARRFLPTSGNTEKSEGKDQK